jgi:hypothetical protein
MTHTPIPDSYWVPFTQLPAKRRPSAGRLLAGEYPSAKQLDAAIAKLARFLYYDVTFFLDLTEVGEYQLRPYALSLRELGHERGQPITHQRMSIPDMGTPDVAQMKQILNTIDKAVGQGETVYVHCYGGIGRTGTVIGCWLVRHGLTGTEALAQIAHWRAGTPDGHRPSPETAAQRQMVLDWPIGG